MEIRITKREEDGYYLPGVYKNEDTGVINNYVLISKYQASLNNGKLESLSGTEPLVSTNIVNFRNYAKATGDKYQLLDIHAVDVIQTLFSIEFATLNSQDVMKGLTNGTKNISGQTDAVQSKSGSITSNTTGKFAMKYRGIEHLYGNIYQSVDGINIQSNKIFVSNKPSTYQSNVFSGDYKEVGYYLTTSSTFVTKMGYDPNFPHVSLPISVASQSSSLYNDMFSYASGNRILLFGGHWNTNDNSGIYAWHLDASTTAGVAYGGRFIKRAS